MIPLGLVIANDWGGPLQELLYGLHQSIGALIMPLILMRLVYRWATPPAPLPGFRCAQRARNDWAASTITISRHGGYPLESPLEAGG